MITITIDYDSKLNKLLVRCPMWANDLVKSLPDRRWSKAQRAWMVPLLRMNVEGVGRLTQIEGVQLTDAAKTAVEVYLAAKPKPKPGFTAFPAWYKFKRAPRKHQMVAINKKYGMPAFALHADRGTGKTLIEINCASALRMEGKIDAMLVCVKLSGRKMWAEELEKDCPIPYDVFLPVTSERKAFDKWLRRKHDFKILVVGIESLSQGRMPEIVNAFLSVYNKVYMVVDEAHLIANYKAGRTEHCVAFGKQCAFRTTATGTPISTGPLNLYSQFEFLDPDIIGIGDYYAFRNQYAVIIERETKQGQKFPMLVGYKNLDELTKAVAPYTYECRKSDVLDLPPKIFHKAYVQMAAKQRDLYDQIRKEKAYQFKGKELVIKNVLELALRLHQVTGGFVSTYVESTYIGRGGVEKIRRTGTAHPIIPTKSNPKIIELLDLAQDDCQFIVWCAYKAEINAVVEALSNAFPKERIVQIHGGITESDRAAYRNLYQKGGAKFMVGNTATGGTADTWTACEHMVYFSNTDKMVDREQSEDRAHRDGLTHSVNYTDIIAEGTIDELIIRSNAAKVDLSEYIRRNIREAAALLLGEAAS